jgi:hypothetical protein
MEVAMSAEAATLPMPSSPEAEGKRRGRKPNDTRDKDPLVLFFLAEANSGAGALVLKEKFENEGHAIVASLTRGKPYYRVEVWQSRAVVTDGHVTVEKQPVRDGT